MARQTESGIVDGTIAAAVTPRNRNEEIDFGAAFELVDFLSRSGLGGMAFFTAIGEYASLAPDDRSRLLCLAIRRSRVPVYAGIGAATLESALALAHGARDGGAAALLLPPPHGFAYAQDDLCEFYLQFAAHRDGFPPVYLIDSPGLCTPIAPETAQALLATGSFAGVAANVSDIACAIPELAAARDVASPEQAAALDGRIAEFAAWATQFPAPVAIKTAVGLRGVKMGPLAIPLTAEKQRRLEEFRAWFTAWLPEVKKAAKAG